MKIFDLTHEIRPDMPVYPGTKPPVFKIANTLEQDGFIEKELTFYSHTGTHIDSPAHIFPEGKTLDIFEPDYFYGPAVVLDVSIVEEICVDHLTPFLADIEKASHVILYTGWDRYWGKDHYFNDFPVLTKEAAQWLVNLGIKAIGVDTISVDKVEEDSAALPIHNILLGNNVLVIENLTNLKDLVGERIVLCCMPLKTHQADGAPARAMAIVMSD